MLPSLFATGETARAWSVPRAAIYGAGIGALAALFRTLGPLHAGDSAAARIAAIGAAAVALALVCAGAALARNLIARRLIWPDLR
jgi:predicted permease